MIHVEWKPFMIDPGTNLNGETVEAYCRRRWGGSGWTKSMISSGKKDGAYFKNWKWWPHTLKAHQLIQFLSSSASNMIMSDKVNQALFHAEYEQGANISNIDTLLEIAKDLLLVQDNDDTTTNNAEQILKELHTYLVNDKGVTQVQDEIHQGRQRYGISGVPYFIIGLENNNSNTKKKPYGFSGAQASETFVELFEELGE